MEQQFIVQYSARCSLRATETFDEMKGVYGDSLFAWQTIFRRHRQLKEGRELAVLNTENRGRKHSSVTLININTVPTRIKDDPYLSVRQLASDLNLSQSLLHQILKDELNVRRYVVPGCRVS